MRAATLLIVAGLIALTVAVLTGSTPMSVIVVGLAAAGIVSLLRDWRADRSIAVQPTYQPAYEEDGAAEVAAADPEAAEDSPDRFSPDISTDPDGPSSNARAD